MKKLTMNIIIFSMLALLFIPVSSQAFPNLIMNGDFEKDLDYWAYGGNVWAPDYQYPVFYSPSGDGSHFASIISTDEDPNPYLRQTIDMSEGDLFRLKLDFTIATFEPTWSDDFRAQLSINYPGGGPYHPIFSFGTGSSLLTDYDAVNHPGLRFHTEVGFTYDFFWDNPDDDLVLDFLVLGYGDDNWQSAMFLDNLSLTAVPEPTTMSLLLLGFGLTGIGFYRRRKNS